MNSNILKFIFSIFQESFEFINPKISNHQEFSRVLSRKIQIKENQNIQYGFDVELDEIIKNKIKEFNISGKIFSEESGWFEFGDKKYRVVYDPFCNSSLASKTFFEAAIGISIFSYDYEFITSAIMDFQTGVVGLVEDEKTNFYQIQTKDKITFDYPKNESLEDSWTVISLEKQKERKNLDQVDEILKESKRIMVSSGHLYWLKLATGAIDIYLDPFGGERLYEIFACVVAQKAGCIVSDLNGRIFDPVEYLKIFENDQNYIYYPIAATNSKLHNKILNLIQL